MGLEHWSKKKIEERGNKQKRRDEDRERKEQKIEKKEREKKEKNEEERKRQTKSGSSSVIWILEETRAPFSLYSITHLLELYSRTDFVPCVMGLLMNILHQFLPSSTVIQAMTKL